MECLQLAATIYEGTATHVTGELRANVILPSHNESVGSVTEQECALGCVYLCDTGHRVSFTFCLPASDLCNIKCSDLTGPRSSVLFLFYTSTFIMKSDFLGLE